MATFKNTVEAETESQKYAAYLDASRRNTNNKSTYSARVQLKIDKVRYCFIDVFNLDKRNVYENYNKRSAGIKLNGNFRYRKDIKTYLTQLETEGANIVHTRQGTNVNFPRTVLEDIV